MKRLTLITLVGAWSLASLQAEEPLKGFSYGKMTNPTGKEWQAPEHYAHGKLQPHATFYSFGSSRSALGVLPEHSEYYHSLNGLWRFHWVGNPEERPQNFYQTSFDDSSWEEVSVPMNWNVYGLEKDGRQRFGTPIYVNQPVIFQHSVAVDDWRGGVMRTPPKDWTTYKHRNEVGSYRRKFTIPTEWSGREVYIEFEGVDSFFYIWVNGDYVGFSKNSRNRAEFDLTPYLVSGENTLAVEVYRSSDGSFLESQDMFRLPGIFRTVALTSKPKVQIRDIQITPDLSADLQTGTLQVKTKLQNLHKVQAKGYKLTYQLYSLPLYSDTDAKPVSFDLSQSASDKGLLIPSASSLEVSEKLNIKTPALWSAEAPHRYILIAQLLGHKGEVVETVSSYIGFRKVEIKDIPAKEDEFGLAGRYFLINGKPVKLKGVNRHETHPATGHVLTQEQMREEVMMMKRANINHVRNSHYPPAPYFYYLADKYGLYLEDEANIESHQYYYGKASLSHVKEFDIPTTNRMLEMVYANINHPSIVIWSLGNEAGPGVNFVNSYKATKAVDTSRPIQYERNNDIVDMGSNQYPSIPWVQEAVKGKYNIKYPFHISEYAHSMGNAVGGLQDYWTAIESTNFFCGGAIWDWVDQALYNYTPEGKRYFAYGGDFGDTPNDGMFVMNGIIFADRNPKPQYYEVKKVYQNAGFSQTDDQQTIRLFNKRYYTDLSHDYKLRWTVYAEGIKQEEGLMDVPNVAPRSSTDIRIPYTEPKDTSKEYFLNLELILREDKPWAKAGFVQADEQFSLSSASLPKLQITNTEVKLKVEDKRKEEGKISLSGEDGFRISFDSSTGTLTSLYYNGRAMLIEGQGPRLDAFRAAADNDNWAYPAWGQNGLHNLKHKATSSDIFVRKDGAVVVTFSITSQAPNAAKIYDHRASGRYKIEEQTSKPFGENDFKFISSQTWTIYPDGSLELQANITSNRPKLALGRLGFELVLPDTFQNYTYYGRGPINNYSDRKSSQFVGIHHSTIAEQFVNFPKPQTMGNREDVRWITLTDDEGVGILFQAGNTMSASALPWSAKELLLAPHPHELPKSQHTYLHLDASVNGLGGNSCGQGGPLSDCRAQAHPQLFSFIIRPYKGGEVRRVALQGERVPIAYRSDRGEIRLFSGDDTLSSQYEYSLNGKSFKPYTKPFDMRDAGSVTVRSKQTPRLRSTVSFSRLEVVPLSVVFASSEEASETPASNLVDGDPETIWHTTYRITTAVFPHWVDFDAGQTISLKGFRYQARQTGENGNIKNYTISTSLDGKTWQEVYKGSFANSKAPQTIQLSQGIKMRYIRLTALSNHSGQDYASGAEFAILTD